VSIAASKYALTVLEADAELGQGARAVLLALSIRANVNTHDTFTGGWLCRAAGMNERNVRRNVHRLAELGLIAVNRRDGKSSVIRFPLGAALTIAPRASGAGRTDENGAFHPGICACPDCAELAAEA